VIATALHRGPVTHLRWDGGARSVLLLHGVGGGRESWGDTMSGTGLAIARAGYRALALDLPGYGASESITPYTLQGMARCVLSLIDELGDAPVAVVGHSLGGMVAQELMALAPERVAALVLMATTPAFGKPDGAWQREFLSQRLAPLDDGEGMAALAPGLVAGMAAPGAAHDAVARAALLMAAVPEATYRQALQALMAFDRRSLLGALRLPVLCLAGAHDRNAPPVVMKQMADRIEGAEYRCLAGVGHLAHMEAPDPVNAALIDFLHRRFEP
jgi:3-oxoadipate enol-lactonase